MKGKQKHFDKLFPARLLIFIVEFHKLGKLLFAEIVAVKFFFILCFKRCLFLNAHILKQDV